MRRGNTQTSGLPIELLRASAKPGDDLRGGDVPEEGDAIHTNGCKLGVITRADNEKKGGRNGSKR